MSEQLTQFLKKAEPFVVESGILLDIIGDSYNYMILRQAFEPRLPGFVGLIDDQLFMADSTPEQFREYIFWHEVKCVVKRQRQGCTQTVMEELQRVPKYMLRQYIEYRYVCFGHLVEFSKNQPPDFYSQLLASQRYLYEQLNG